MIYDTTGQPLPGNPDSNQFMGWAQAETARAQLHFYMLYDREDYDEKFKRIETFIHEYLTDHEYGGWYHRVDVTDRYPAWGTKRGHLEVACHYSMFFSEVLRLNEG